ncbi:MAG: VaFE repeat-containing surface-anchored protein, partial [Atopobiaceae bacterium]
MSVTETKAPKGYLLSDASAHVVKVTADGTAEHVSTYVAPEVADHVARGDLSFSKVDEQTMRQLAGCAFMLTSETTGESHVLVTDENGMFDSAASWVPHTRGTDGNDAALSAAGSVDDEGLDASRGVWFGAGTKADDSLGALPYDTYDLRELPCAANAGHALTERTVTISRDRTDLDIGTVDDKQVSIRTEATDAATGTHESEAAAKQTIVDTVSYANLTPGKEYVLTGTLVDKATGKAIQSGGADVTATTTFTPEEPDGTAQVTFEFDGTATTGRTLVAFESLSQDGREVATHADVDDEGQTVTVPKVGTEATGKASGTHEEQATGKTEIVDTVSYANLVPGKEYALTGTLVDKATGKAIQSGGADVTATTTFTPEKADGTAQVTFELDASALAGTTTVAFETLSREGREVATHADISDAGQTVSLVGVGTKAADKATGTNEGTPADRVTIVDTVSYTGLTPGKEYVLTGTLMDASTGKAWQQDGADVTATTTLTPEKAEGTAEVAFEIDGSALDGRTLVCFESLSRDGRQVAAHADISDAGQSVSYESPQTPPETPPATQEGLPKTGDDLPAVALLGLLGAG